MNLFTLSFLLVLIQFEHLSDSYSIRLVPVLFLFASFIRYAFYNSRINISNLYSNYTLFFLCIIMLFIGTFRNNNYDISFSYLVYRSVIVLLFIISFFGYLYSNINRLFQSPYKFFEKTIMLPFLIYGALNIFLWVFNIQIENSVYEGDFGESVFLSYFGLHISRVQFPLAGGFNNYSSLMGALFSITLVSLFVLNKRTLINFLGIFVFLGSLLLIDTRTSLFYPIIITLFIYYLKNRHSIKRVIYIIFIPILGPLLLTFLLPFISDIPAFSFLARSSEDLETGNSRFLIWAISLNEFLQFKWIHIIGFGEFGHFGSGASKIWASIFGNWESSETKSPHSTLFEILFDYGYIGIIFYTLLLGRFTSSIIKYWSLRNELSLIFLSFLFFTIFQGITESLFGFYFFTFIILFFAIFIFCFLIDEEIFPAVHKEINEN